MIILGVDPGTAATGYGVIKKTADKLELVCYGNIQTSPDSPPAERLSEIDRQLANLIKKNRPQKIAVENIFFFKNQKTVIGVSQARGVILARAAKMNISLMAERTKPRSKKWLNFYSR